MARKGRVGAAPDQDEVTDAVLAGSRVLIAIAARSLSAAGEDVTLAQYRTLVVLAYQGAQRTVDLSDELGVSSSTATRMIDRLVRRGLVRRDVHPGDKRANRVEISDEGRAIVTAVMKGRRTAFAKILRKMGADERQCLVDGLQALTAAAGEPDEHPRTLGWGTA